MKSRARLIFLLTAGLLAVSAPAFAGRWNFGIGFGGEAPWFAGNHCFPYGYTYGYYTYPHMIAYFPYANPYRYAFPSYYPPGDVFTAPPLQNFYYQGLYSFWVPPMPQAPGRIPFHWSGRPPQVHGPGTPYIPRRYSWR